jgi:threonine synthase
VSEGTVAPDESCVAILTGNGLKDPETALSQASAAMQTVEPSADALAAFLGL